MPLPSFDSKDAIPEAFRDGYVERDGKWVPDDSEYKGLKTSQQRILDEKKATDAELAKYKGALGTKSLDDIAALLKAQETAEDDKHRKAGDIDKLVQKRIDELKAEYDPQLKAGQDAMTKLAAKEFEEQVWDAAKGAGALDADRKIILKVAKDDYVRRDDKTGKLIVVDKDGDVTGEDLGKLFSGRFKTEHSKFYGTSVGSGGGAGAGNGGAGHRPAGNGTVAAGDNNAFLANVDKIAKGEVKVVE